MGKLNAGYVMAAMFLFAAVVSWFRWSDIVLTFFFTVAAICFFRLGRSISRAISGYTNSQVRK